MIVVVQRVSSASVTVAEPPVHRAIDRGVVALVGVERGDDDSAAEHCADKIAALRIFPDQNGKMNLSVVDVNGSALVVSQFTLAGDTRKGTRPSFTRAEDPALAEPLVELVAARLESHTGMHVERGVFGASMRVELVNEGPVTLIVQR